ncbi:hypothetical protein BSKO_00665 [Bryopsis sp. KO-2023]|nr:hypothetical protein BSKO_00665 [Bryopsis sp. KO-2023]
MLVGVRSLSQRIIHQGLARPTCVSGFHASRRSHSRKQDRRKSFSVFSAQATEQAGTSPDLVDCTGKAPAACLVDWSTANGADLSGARIEKSALGGVGLLACDDFLQDEVIFRVPMHLSLMVYPFEIYQSLAIPSKGLPDTTIKLACKLIDEKNRGHKSPWFPYIASLPQNLTNPRSMSEGIAHVHAGSDAFSVILGNYDGTVQFMTSLGKNLDDIRWALSVIQSRAFGNGRGQELLVPMVDSMNHGDLVSDNPFADEHQANVTYGWQRRGPDNTPSNFEMVIKATRTISEGEELLVSYGDHENEYFYLYYGFVPMFNSRDDLVIFNGLDDAFEWYCNTYPKRAQNLSAEERKKLFKEVKVEGDLKNVIKMNICADGSVSPIMLEFFKMLFDGEEEEAELAIARSCFDLLQKLSGFLEDLESLSTPYSEEPNVFRYYDLSYRKDIQSFLTRVGMPQGGGSRMEEKVEIGSREWWLIVHGVLKKKIAWDYILDLDPSGKDLGLS